MLFIEQRNNVLLLRFYKIRDKLKYLFVGEIDKFTKNTECFLDVLTCSHQILEEKNVDVLG